jgi:hypothetical protein
MTRWVVPPIWGRGTGRNKDEKERVRGRKKTTRTGREKGINNVNKSVEGRKL